MRTEIHAAVLAAIGELRKPPREYETAPTGVSAQKLGRALITRGYEPAHFRHIILELLEAEEVVSIARCIVEDGRRRGRMDMHLIAPMFPDSYHFDKNGFKVGERGAHDQYTNLRLYLTDALPGRVQDVIQRDELRTSAYR